MKLKIRKSRVKDLCLKAKQKRGSFYDLISDKEKLQTLGLRIQSDKIMLLFKRAVLGRLVIQTTNYFTLEEVEPSPFLAIGCNEQQLTCSQHSC